MQEFRWSFFVYFYSFLECTAGRGLSQRSHRAMHKEWPVHEQMFLLTSDAT